jgi:hypothetical protein
VIRSGHSQLLPARRGGTAFANPRSFLAYVDGHGAPTDFASPNAVRRKSSKPKVCAWRLRGLGFGRASAEEGRIRAGHHHSYSKQPRLPSGIAGRRC